MIFFQLYNDDLERLEWYIEDALRGCHFWHGWHYTGGEWADPLCA